MKTQIALISSALMVSTAALAATGSMDTETSVDTENRSYEGSSSISGDASRDGVSTEINREGEFSGPNVERSSSGSLSSSVSFNDMTESPDEAFSQMDEDSNGVLSQLETEGTPLRDRFDSADEDGDSTLTDGEFSNFVASLGDNMGEEDSDASDEAEDEFDEAEDYVEDEFGE